MATNYSGEVFVETHTVTTTVANFPPPVRTKFLQLYNEGANQVRVFFRQSDTGDNDAGLLMAANGTQGDYFEGPVELTAERGLWLQSITAGSTVRAVYYKEGV